MKISQDIRSQFDSANKPKSNIADGKQSFQQIVQSQNQKLQQAELQKLMQNITVQGNKLAKFRSFKDLAKFKRLVKSFLQEVVDHGLDLESSHSYSLSGSSRQLTVVKQIDEKLIELTEELMNHEKKSVDLLGLIGEIKGLLINLYT